MRAAGGLGAIAGLLLGAMPLAAQDAPVRIDPEEARRCAIWASFLAEELAGDADTQRALLFVTNYFVGQYEGATGRSIAQSGTLDVADLISQDFEQATTLCTGHMETYADRMGQWGDQMEQWAETQEPPAQ